MSSEELITFITNEVAKSVANATSKSWEAGLLASFMVVVMCVLIWLVRSWMSGAQKREERMATRIDRLEDYQVNVLTKMVDDCRTTMEQNVGAFQRLVDTLNGKPCLWSPEKQREFLLEVTKHG